MNKEKQSKKKKKIVKPLARGEKNWKNTLKSLLGWEKQEVERIFSTVCLFKMCMGECARKEVVLAGGGKEWSGRDERRPYFLHFCW